MELGYGNNSLPYTKAMDTCLVEDGRPDWVAGMSIVACGLRVGIRTNKPKLLDRLMGAVPGIWKPTSTALVDRLYSLKVATAGAHRAGLSRHELFEDLQRVANSDDLNRIVETFERQLKIYLAEMARRKVFLHAGAVGWQGKAIIVPGKSFSGKTSLVAELVRAGATYYSDEYAVLDRRGRVHPYPAPLSVREPSSFKQKSCKVEEFGGSNGIEPLPVGLVVISQYEQGRHWRPHTLSAGQAMLELLANAVPVRRKPKVVMATLQEVVSEALVLKSVRGEAGEAACLILDEIKASAKD